MSALLGSQGPLLWYVNRSTGLVLLVLLTLTVALGVLSARRPGGPGASRGALPRFVPQAVHRSLGLLSVLLLALHVAAAVVDEYVDIRWWQAFVPADLHYQPWPLALGVVASDVLLAAVLTSLLRTRLRHRHWRVLHLTAYAAWGTSLAHGLAIGTDTALPAVTGTYVGCAAVVALAVAHRLLPGSRRRADGRAAHPLVTSSPALPRRSR